MEGCDCECCKRNLELKIRTCPEDIKRYIYQFTLEPLFQEFKKDVCETFAIQSVFFEKYTGVFEILFLYVNKMKPFKEYKKQVYLKLDITVNNDRGTVSLADLESRKVFDIIQYLEVYYRISLYKFIPSLFFDFINGSILWLSLHPRKSFAQMIVMNKYKKLYFKLAHKNLSIMLRKQIIRFHE